MNVCRGLDAGQTSVTYKNHSLILLCYSQADEGEENSLMGFMSWGKDWEEILKTYKEKIINIIKIW